MVSNTAPQLLSASTISGDTVRDAAGKDIGKIKELMVDLSTGRIAYAVLSFGGFLGLGDKLFAIPWGALRVDTANHAVVLSTSKQVLENAKGFDKDSWPNFADPRFHEDTYRHYSQKPYWTGASEASTH